MPCQPIYRNNIGKGIYVTTLDPFTNNRDFLREQLFLGGNSPIVRQKLDCFVAIHREDVKKCRAVVIPYPGRSSALKIVPASPNLPLYEIRHCFGYT